MTRRLLMAPLAAAALAAAAAPAPAALRAVSTPMVLPGDAAAAGVWADPGRWIVGARPGPASAAVAERYGARLIAANAGGGYVVGAARARAFARALRARGLLVYAQPDAYAELRQVVQDDPLSGPPNAWRSVVADPNLAPPPLSATSPLIALVDSVLDPSHPEFQGGNVSTLAGLDVATLPPGTNCTNAPAKCHGTSTAAVAAAPKNNIGILGVWPGARALNVPLPDEIKCSDSAKGIARAIDAGAAVINMSYGSQGLCVPEYVALQRAVKRGVVPVAAAGNELQAGNPFEFPASLPHVLTVAATDQNNKPTGFSNRNAAVDLSAPGDRIMTAVPPSLDDDGTQDGYQQVSGTSFSAPMVAAAVAWVRQARPDLTVDQLTQVIRLSANDVGRRGWEANSGFGILSVGNALVKPPPPADPLEPNDDVQWVDGRHFGKAVAPIFTGRRTARLIGLLDAFEDPADVYRIRLRPHSRVRVIAKPVFGNPLLVAFSKQIRSVGPVCRPGGKCRPAPRPLATSRRKGTRTERISLRNRGRKAHLYYVALGVQRGGTLDAAYRLTIKRP